MSDDELRSLNWQTFNLSKSGLYNIQKGNDFKPEELIHAISGINLVGDGTERSGIIGEVAEMKFIKPFPKNSITISFRNNRPCAFVQPHEFYTTGNVVVLTPTKKVNLNQTFFICTMINKYHKDWSGFTFDDFVEYEQNFLEVLLPHDTEGKVDLKFMNSYIEKLMEKLKN